MDINELRELALNRHKAATRKVSRLKSNGVEISGTQLDVRRDPKRIKKYTRSQLNSYIRKLDTFVSRRTSYVASAVPDKPLNPARVAKYKANEERLRKYGKEEASEFAKISLRGEAMTVGEYDELSKSRSGNKFTYGDVTTRIYGEMGALKSTSIYGPEALEKLIAQQEKRLKGGYKKSKLDNQRSEAKQMAASFGDPDMDRAIENLTDNQFNIWFNYTKEAKRLKRGYVKKQHGGGNQASAQIAEDDHQELLESLQWADQLPAERTPNKPARGRRGKRK